MKEVEIDFKNIDRIVISKDPDLDPKKVILIEGVLIITPDFWSVLKLTFSKFYNPISYTFYNIPVIEGDFDIYKPGYLNNGKKFKF